MHLMKDVDTLIIYVLTSISLVFFDITASLLFKSFFMCLTMACRVLHAKEGNFPDLFQDGEALSILSYVDMKRFALRFWPDKAAVEKAMGLAKLTALVLRKQLDKTQQVWH